MVRVLCIGDSLSLPGHGNLYENTWIKILKQEFPQYDFISFFKRHLTTDVLNKMGGGEKNLNALPLGADCLEHYMPEIVILQLGIVDCAPRLINNQSIAWKIIRRMPASVVQKYIKRLKKKKRDPENVKVNKEKFEQNLSKYFERCQNINIKKLLYISIPIPDERMVAKNEGITHNALIYNDIIQNLAKKHSFIDVISQLNSEKQENIYDDGYHPNPAGNKLVADTLIQSINNLPQ
jgi:acyl-CoA thioesterase-1